ncbi:uncharacterized protein LOC134851940 [Symsagittifera roscoffensis]|uniref:uncharacterized protein LOC134851940 n=1 Tax=Symsagittifera roscoffensis TaxID=84072 RepID=UPI00307B69C6
MVETRSQKTSEERKEMLEVEVNTDQARNDNQEGHGLEGRGRRLARVKASKARLLSEAEARRKDKPQELVTKKMQAVTKETREPESVTAADVFKIDYRAAAGDALNRVQQELVTKEIEQKAPRTDTQLMSFLGFANYYREFNKGYADKVYPMQKLMRNKGKKFEWNDEAEVAFENIKRELCEAPVLEWLNEMTSDPEGTSVTIQDVDRESMKYIKTERDDPPGKDNYSFQLLTST